MSRTVFIKCKVVVTYFIFIFILPSIVRSSVKMSVNQLIKNKGLMCNMFKLYEVIQNLREF